MRNIVSPLSGIRSPFGGRSDLYKIAGFRPEFVADFGGEYYRANLARSTFANTLTHAATSNATMVDSDGLLKWRPHNLLTYSEQFDNADWLKSGVTVTSNAAVAPSGTATADRLQDTGAGTLYQGPSLPSGQTFTIAFWVKSFGGTDQTFRLYGNGSNISSDQTATADWQLFTHEFTSTGVSGTGITDGSASGTYDILVWGAHLYRSDLGGMVDNPDRGDSYVPTTSAAVYLPRRGHHIWDGSAWVDAGYLHESEARTNLLLNSATLSTQDVTVTAVPHTLHFTGTGTITLSGASTAGPLVGTGTGENNRVSLTFTPSAGTLTLTVSGTVTNADLEVGSTLSSHKPTSGSTATRAAETLTIPSANLPWPTPRVIGDELVTNGTFDTDSDWTKGTGWTISGGVASNDGTNDFSLSQDIGLTAGAVYEVTYEVTSFTSGIVSLSLGESRAANRLTANAAGTYTKIMVASASSANVVFYPEATFIGTIDNISVKEINPLSVCIQMEGDLTYADTDAATEARLVNWLADGNNYIIKDLATNFGSVGRLAFVQRESGSGTSVVQSSSVYSPGINVPFNIASRHGSTFINGAVGGTALTEDTTPVALPDLSSTDLEIAYDFMGNVKQVRIWAVDIGDTGIEAATT